LTIQILNSSDYDLKQIARKIQLGDPVLFFEQDLTQNDYIKLMKRFGECEHPDLFMNPKDNPEIFIVTGKRDKEGKKIGMFGETELGWHSNGNSRHNVDKILIGLYCVKEDENTALSICNTARPFQDLDDKLKDYYRDITIKIKFKNDTIYHLEEGDPELEFMSASKGSIRKLVGRHPHIIQQPSEYFYFPYHFIEKAWRGKMKIDVNQLIQELKQHIFKSRYMTHHIFHKGDLVLMDQFTSLHRRTPVHDNNRLLWRIACDYRNIV